MGCLTTSTAKARGASTLHPPQRKIHSLILLRHSYFAKTCI
jgi:hypothetical protein